MKVDQRGGRENNTPNKKDGTTETAPFKWWKRQLHHFPNLLGVVGAAFPRQPRKTDFLLFEILALDANLACKKRALCVSNPSSPILPKQNVSLGGAGAGENMGGKWGGGGRDLPKKMSI